MIAIIRSANLKFGRSDSPHTRRAAVKAVKKPNVINMIGHVTKPGGKPPLGRQRKSPDWTVVVIVSVAVTGPEPGGVTPGGEKVHFVYGFPFASVFAGRPLQPRSTTWLNPFDGVTVRV
jgi:hypothetical protein